MWGLLGGSTLVRGIALRTWPWDAWLNDLGFWKVTQGLSLGVSGCVVGSLEKGL